MTIRPCLTKKLWLSFILSLVVIISGCNGELTEEETSPPTGEPPVTPPPVVTPPPTEELVGTWEDKDEDGDGVLDENDDYPFDAERTSYPLIEEEEFNNNPSVANDAGQLPFIAKGSFELDIDIDDFKFIVTQEDIDSRIPYHFIVLSENPTLSPRLGVLNADGKAELTASTDGNLENVGLIKNTRLFFPEEAGTYYLTVGNRNEKASTSLTYTVFAFKDKDMDGIADDKEKALGSDYEIQDSDSDEIFDGNEYFIHRNIRSLIVDVDSDGIPNWLDEDSDGDSIPDIREGLVNEDFDIRPSFSDLDSDDDGITDNEEASNKDLVKDSDNDGILNYQDVDDDGDGLINSYDNDDNQAIKFDKGIQLTNTITSYQNIQLTNRVKSFFPTSLLFFGEVNNEIILVLQKSGSQTSVQNIKLELSGEKNGSIEFVVPNYPMIDLGGNKIDLFLVYDGKKTNTISLDLVHEDAPLLRRVTSDNNIVGEKVFVEGINFTGDLRAKLNDIEIVAEFDSSSDVSFLLPEGTKSGELAISNEYGLSNAIDFDVREKVQVSSIIPQEYLSISGSLSIGDNEFSSILDLVDNQISIQREKYNLLSVYSESAKGYIFRTFIVEGESTVIFNMDKTAEAIVLNGFVEQYPVETIFKIRDFLNENSEFTDFKDYVEQGLINDFDFLDITNEDLYKKVVSIQYVISNYLSESVSVNKNNGTFNKLLNTSIASQKSQNSDQRPVISPHDAQDNIKVEPTLKGITDFFDYDGYTELQNSTQMYLSAAVYSIDSEGMPNTTPEEGKDPTDNKKVKKYEHIESPLDRNMMAPVDYVAFSIPYWSKDTDLDICPYSDCLIEVITPGDNGEPLIDQNKIDVRTHLYIRNLIDRVLWPTIKVVVGEVIKLKKKKNGSIGDDGNTENTKDPHVLHITSILIEAMPDFFDSVRVAFKDGSVTTAEQQDIYNELNVILKKEKDSLLYLKSGPILSYILDILDYSVEDFFKDLAEEIVKDVAVKFIPIIGEIDIAIDILGRINDGANVTKAWYDLYNLKSKYEFRVTWGLKLLEMFPEFIENKNKDQTLNIKGTGLCPIYGFFSNTYPVVYLKDKNSDKFYQKELSNEGEFYQFYKYSERCDSAEFIIPGSFLSQLTPESKVIVEFRFGDDEIANSEAQNTRPPYLLVGDGLKISRVTPNPMHISQQVEIHGFGFSSKTEKNKVYFPSKNGGQVAANVTKSTLTKLEITVPKNAATGSLEVIVETLSATTPIEIKDTEINYAFGDNGNLQDDSFQLLIDNVDVTTSSPGQRRLDGTLTIPAGEKQVKLVGVTVPDSRATFYLCFSNNVQIVSGSTSSKVDFDEGTQFVQNLTIKIDSSAPSEPIHCNDQVQNVTIKNQTSTEYMVD